MDDNLDALFHTPPTPAKKRRSRKDLEAGVLRECIEWLKRQTSVIYVERRNTGAVQFADGGFIRFGAKGAADLWCLVRTISGACGWNDGETVLEHAEIECKRRDGKGKLSAEQKKFQDFCHNAGIAYCVVTSAADLKDEMENLFPECEWRA
jgi:hypothetical protein